MSLPFEAIGLSIEQFAYIFDFTIRTDGPKSLGAITSSRRTIVKNLDLEQFPAFGALDEKEATRRLSELVGEAHRLLASVGLLAPSEDKYSITAMALAWFAIEDPQRSLETLAGYFEANSGLGETTADTAVHQKSNTVEESAPQDSSLSNVDAEQANEHETKTSTEVKTGGFGSNQNIWRTNSKPQPDDSSTPNTDNDKTEPNRQIHSGFGSFEQGRQSSSSSSAWGGIAKGVDLDALFNPEAVEESKQTRPDPTELVEPESEPEKKDEASLLSRSSSQAFGTGQKREGTSSFFSTGKTASQNPINPTSPGRGERGNNFNKTNQTPTSQPPTNQTSPDPTSNDSSKSGGFWSNSKSKDAGTDSSLFRNNRNTNGSSIGGTSGDFRPRSVSSQEPQGMTSQAATGAIIVRLGDREVSVPKDIFAEMVQEYGSSEAALRVLRQQLEDQRGND